MGIDQRKRITMPMDDLEIGGPQDLHKSNNYFVLCQPRIQRFLFLRRYETLLRLFRQKSNYLLLMSEPTL